jgi:hypothetical protein
VTARHLRDAVDDAVDNTSLVSSLRSTPWSKRCLLMSGIMPDAYASQNVGQDTAYPSTRRKTRWSPIGAESARSLLISDENYIAISIIYEFAVLF